MAQEYVQAWWGTWWPWAEANQGVLSVGALVAALLVAIIEQRRANRADANQSAALLAAEERSRRESRQADDRLRRAEAGEMLRRVNALRAGVLSIFEDIEDEALREIEVLRSGNAFMSAGFRAFLEFSAASLEALLPAIPQDGSVIMSIRRVIGENRRLVTHSTSWPASATNIMQIERMRQELRIQHDAMHFAADVFEDLYQDAAEEPGEPLTPPPAQAGGTAPAAPTDRPSPRPRR